MVSPTDKILHWSSIHPIILLTPPPTVTKKDGDALSSMASNILEGALISQEENSQNKWTQRTNLKCKLS